MEYIRCVDELSKEDIALAGGKGTQLGELKRAGFNVPNVFFVLTNAYESSVDEIGEELKNHISNLTELGYADLVRGSLKVKRLIQKRMPKKVEEEVRAAYSHMKEKYGEDIKVSIRSSGTAEDMPEDSFSGMYDSYLRIEGADEVIKYIQKCWGSLHNPRAVQYSKKRGIDRSKVSMGVCVMEMIEADFAGTAFTTDPMTKDPNTIVIEAATGTGESIVDGTAEPSRYLVDKSDLSYELDSDLEVLSEENIQKVSELALDIEKYFGKPQDMEWAIKDDELYVLQSRNITGLEKKYVMGLNEYEGECDRVLGFVNLDKAGVSIPSPIFVITNDAFQEYKENGMVEELTGALTNVFDEIRAANPDKDLIARRAFVVKGVSNPSGPRSLPINSSEELIESIKYLFDFAANPKIKYDKRGNDISGFVHAMVKPIFPDVGGCIALEGGEAVIKAVYGNDEGVQSLIDDTDTYYVNLNKLVITKKNVNAKTKYLQTFIETEVPEEFMNKQTLSDEEVIMLAEEYRKITEVVKNPRVEFDFENGELYFIECTSFDVNPLDDFSREHRMYEVFRIKDADGLEEMVDYSAVFIDPQIIVRRDWDLINAVACGVSKETLIKYPGSVATAHNANIFRELGLDVELVGSRTYNTGDRVFYNDIGEEFVDPTFEDVLLLYGLNNPKKLETNADEVVEYVKSAISPFRDDVDYNQIIERMERAKNSGDFDKEFPNALRAAIDFVRYR